MCTILTVSIYLDNKLMNQVAPYSLNREVNWNWNLSCNGCLVILLSMTYGLPLMFSVPPCKDPTNFSFFNLNNDTFPNVQ